MATYRIKSPDGQSYDVTAPDNASQADVMAYAQKNFAPEKPWNPTDDMSGMERFAAGVGKSVVDTGRGLGQLVGMGPTRAEQDENKRLDASLMDTGAGMGGNIVGNIAQFAALPGGATLKGASTLGALTGLVQPVGESDSRLMNTGINAVGGAAGQQLARGIGAVIRGPQNSLNPSQQAMAQQAERMGINLSTAQKTGNRFLGTLDSVLERLPSTSREALAKRTAQGEQFTRALTNTFGENADNLGQSVMAAGKDNIGRSYQQIFKDASIEASGFGPRLNLIAKQAVRDLPADKAKVVMNRIDDLANKVEGDAVSGLQYQKWRSTLKSADGDISHYLKMVRGAVDDAASASLGPDKMDDFINANIKYKNLKTAQPLAEKSVNGLASPSLLLERVRAANPNMAFQGAGDIGDLAKIGKAFVKDPTPDSGTAQRLLAQGLLTGGAGGGAFMATGDPGTALQTAAVTGLGTLAIPKIAQRALSSKTLERYLMNGGELDPLLQGLLTRSGVAFPAGLLSSYQ